MNKKLILSTTLAAAPLVVISCGSPTSKKNIDEHLASYSSTFGSTVHLNAKAYNDLYDKMGKQDDVIAIALISNHNVYTDIVKMNSDHEKFWEILKRSKFTFNIYNHLGMGVFINSWKFNGESDWKHGTRTDKNYGDYYPLYWINHQFAQYGVSNWTSSPREVYEISYDDK